MVSCHFEASDFFKINENFLDKFLFPKNKKLS